MDNLHRNQRIIDDLSAEAGRLDDDTERHVEGRGEAAARSLPFFEASLNDVIAIAKRVVNERPIMTVLAVATVAYLLGSGRRGRN